MPRPPAELRDFKSLVEIVACLRGPDGCPWDREQTHRTLTPYALEEVCEMIEAIEKGDDGKIREELGDVLFQVLLHAQLASERGGFDIMDVVESLNGKMVRRHPHVFADVKAENSREVVRNWEALKKSEGSASKDPLDAPPHLPALQRSAKIGFRTGKLKFDWSNAAEVWLKVQEEYVELADAFDEDDDAAIEHELGDLLFSLAQFARHLKKDPEQILRDANRRFEIRFALMMDVVRERGLSWDELADAQKEELWAEAKRREKGT